MIRFSYIVSWVTCCASWVFTVFSCHTDVFCVQMYNGCVTWRWWWQCFSPPVMMSPQLSQVSDVLFWKVVECCITEGWVFVFGGGMVVGEMYVMNWWVLCLIDWSLMCDSVVWHVAECSMRGGVIIVWHDWVLCEQWLGIIQLMVKCWVTDNWCVTDGLV